jgi:hypothetical protein
MVGIQTGERAVMPLALLCVGARRQSGLTAFSGLATFEDGKLEFLCPSLYSK